MAEALELVLGLGTLVLGLGPWALGLGSWVFELKSGSDKRILNVRNKNKVQSTKN